MPPPNSVSEILYTDAWLEGKAIPLTLRYYVHMGTQESFRTALDTQVFEAIIQLSLL